MLDKVEMLERFEELNYLNNEDDIVELNDLVKEIVVSGDFTRDDYDCYVKLFDEHYSIGDYGCDTEYIEPNWLWITEGRDFEF